SVRPVDVAYLISCQARGNGSSSSPRYNGDRGKGKRIAIVDDRGGKAGRARWEDESHVAVMAAVAACIPQLYEAEERRGRTLRVATRKMSVRRSSSLVLDQTSVALLRCGRTRCLVHRRSPVFPRAN
ncbi:hypothetical protein X777_09556, partial [Ooceraea biroi]